MGQEWQTSDGQVVHPNAPRGGGGPGGFRSPKQFGEEGQTSGVPHPSSPLGRNAFLTPEQVRFLQERKLKFNKLNAEAAVAYVKEKMTLGAGNKVGDILATFGESRICVFEERQVTSEWNSIPAEDWLREVAERAAKAGCGNCREQSAIGFVYLLDAQIRPIDWMVLIDGDHAFVVIGRAVLSDSTDPETWGPEAVVCDPWKGETYPPSKLIPMWGHKPISKYRAA